MSPTVNFTFSFIINMPGKRMINFKKEISFLLELLI